MLSAVVVDKNSGLAGRGFFSLARRLNLLNGNSKSAEKAFLNKEKTRIFRYWQ